MRKKEKLQKRLDELTHLVMKTKENSFTYRELFYKSDCVTLKYLKSWKLDEKLVSELMDVFEPYVQENIKKSSGHDYKYKDEINMYNLLRQSQEAYDRF